MSKAQRAAGPKVFKVKVTKSLTAWAISDVLCSAFEGGSDYWAQVRKINKPTSWPNTKEEDRVYMHECPLNPDGFLMIGDRDGGRARKLDLKAIQRGLKIMAQQHPAELQEMINEEGDANTADIFLQCCLFGEVIYG